MIVTPRPYRPTASWRAAMWGTLAALLVLPLVAMQLTPEVRWTPFDFAAAGVLLGGLGAAIEAAMRIAARSRVRAAIIAAALALTLLLWAEGAVGLF